MSKTIETVKPPAAEKMREQDENAVIIDVRSRVEYEFVGHPLGAIHVPWKEFPEWSENSDFCRSVDEVLRATGASEANNKKRSLLMLCRSGARSQAAAEKLMAHGYTQVYNIVEGFEGDKDENNHRGSINGWRYHGLPWEQS